MCALLDIPGELEKKGLINPENYDYLLDHLLQIAREDLAHSSLSIFSIPHTHHMMP